MENLNGDLVTHDSDIKYEDINLPYSRIKTFTPEELDSFVEKVFLYYRKAGYPDFNLSLDERLEEFKRLKRYDCTSLLKDKVIGTAMHCYNVASYYFPHMKSIKCSRFKTPLEMFNDDESLRKVIRKRIIMKEGISDSTIRRMLRIVSGAQGVSNFRPTAACCIYNHFAPGGIVWDMSCGFGGRLTGFLASEAKTYIGTEPDKRTYKGLINLKRDLNSTGKSVSLYMVGSEDFKPEPSSLDLCFTSPPYFDQEKYSDDPSQSYIKFPEIDLWLNGYIRQTFKNCFVGLKPNRYMIINIANTEKHRKMTNAIVKIAQQEGFLHTDTYSLLLSSIKHGGNKKTEPIFIFRKD